MPAMAPPEILGVDDVDAEELFEDVGAEGRDEVGVESAGSGELLLSREAVLVAEDVDAADDVEEESTWKPSTLLSMSPTIGFATAALLHVSL